MTAGSATQNHADDGPIEERLSAHTSRVNQNDPERRLRERFSNAVL